MVSTISNYYLSVLKTPSSTIKDIQNILKDFLCTKNMNGEKKIPLVSLDFRTQAKKIGRVGINDFVKGTKHLEQI